MCTKIYFFSFLIMAGIVLAACAQPTQVPSQPVQTQSLVVSQAPLIRPTIPVLMATSEPAAPLLEFKSKNPGTYVIARMEEPRGFDTALCYNLNGTEIIQNTYDTLIFYKRENPASFVPMLATEVPSLDNGSISADGLTYTFKIRKGVKFHDGTRMTTADVAFTFQRGLLQGRTNSPQWLMVEPILGSGLADITDIITPSLAGPDIQTLNDDPENLAKVPADVLLATCKKVTDAIVADDAAGTVTFKLAQPWGPFLATLAGSWGSIQSKAWVKSKGGWDGDCSTWQKFYGKTRAQLNESGLGNTENGTGPYKLDHWTPGEEIVLAANEDYWVKQPLWEGGPSGAPRLKKIIRKAIPEFSIRFAMLQAGDADSIAWGSMVERQQLDSLVGVECQLNTENCREIDPTKPLVRIKGLQNTVRNDMSYNFKIEAAGNTFIGSGKLDGNGIPPNFFSDPLVRKGFAYCFNYDTYLNDVMGGEGVRSVDIMLPGMLGYDENTPIYTYDPAKCIQMLQQSKWKKNDDGSWTPDPAGDISLWDTGFRFTVSYITGERYRQVAAEILHDELGAVNNKFVVEELGLPYETYMNTLGQATIFFEGWAEDIHDPHNWVVPYTTGMFGNWYQQLPADLMAKFAKIYNRAVMETDPAKRAEIYKEFNQLFYDTASTIPLFVAIGTRYQPRWVKGWYYNPLYSGLYFYSTWKE